MNSSRMIDFSCRWLSENVPTCRIYDSELSSCVQEAMFDTVLLSSFFFFVAGVLEKFR